MAEFNEITNPRWQNLVRRIFGLVGPGGNVGLLAPEIQPVAIIQSDSPELRRLRGEHAFMQIQRETGVAGEFTELLAYNPATSGHLVVIERLHPAAFTSTESIFICVFPEITALTTTNGRGMPRDLRTQQANSSVLEFSSDTVAVRHGTGCTFGSFPWGGPGDPTDQDLRDFVLPPGSGILLSARTVNIGIYAVWEWWERAIDPAELKT